MNESRFRLELEAMYDELERLLAPYGEKDYTSLSASQCLADRKFLRLLESDWKSHRKQACEEHQAQIDTIALAYDEGLSRITQFLKKANEAVKRQNDTVKKERLAMIAEWITPILGELSEIFTDSRAFTEASWVHPSTSLAQVKKEATQKAQIAAEKVALLALDTEHAPALILTYAQTMSEDAVMTAKESLRKIEGALPALRQAEYTGEESDHRIGSIDLRLRLTVSKWNSLKTAISLLSDDIQILNDHLPKDPQLQVRPIFDSFVSVDLETTGSLGAKSGDGPAGITEIGAVKVINGEIVERFSLLTNPGRSITPMSQSITHISNEMVKDAPSVADGIRELVRFASDLPMVGHDFWHCDLPLLMRVAMQEGIDLAPTCFDTLNYANENKERMQIDGLSLSSLCEQFGIVHNDKHRALGDAEATALVYLEMRGWEI